MKVNVAYFSPETGAVTATYSGPVEAIPEGVAFTPTPDGADLSDLAAWAVDLETGVLGYVGRPVEPGEVNEERNRRIAAGTTFDLSGGASVVVTGRDEDFRNLTNLALAAQARISQGAGSAITKFRDELNVIHDLDQMQVLELWQRASEYVSAIYSASWAIKDQAEIAADFREDHNWP